MGTDAQVTEWGDEEFEHALGQAAEGILEARHVRLSAERLDRLLAAAPRSPENPQRSHLTSADFQDTTFTGHIRFNLATFDGDASFRAATFSGDASFTGASFTGDADFAEVAFGGTAWFPGVTFKTNDFDRVTFTGPAYFFGATFTEGALFASATFSEDAHFSTATFTEFANFNGVTFSGNAIFTEATFSGLASFNEATFSGSAANFIEARFEVARELGPVHVYGQLSLDNVVFAQRVRIEASARRASFTGAEFRRGADVRLRWAELWLEDVDFAEPSLLTALPARLTFQGGAERAFLGWEEPRGQGVWCCPVSGEPPEGFNPRVLTLRNSRVGSLTLSGVDLTTCLFADAHGLDDLGLERTEFPWPPDGWRWVRWWPVRWTRRQTIAEEHQWRARGSHGHGWDQPRLPTGSPNPWPPQPAPELEPDRIAGLYRQLRKSREDSRDEPGANDFYYGEMEMRRRNGPNAERAILLLYWLVSGYGLRAWRALLALAVTIALLGAIPLALWGFRPHLHYGRALLFALQSSISLLRAPTTPPAHETGGGQVIEIFLRLAGPLFFGLALLALRGRVKR